jgi:hypothetical protein
LPTEQNNQNHNQKGRFQMHKLRNNLIALAAIAVLGTIGFLMNARKAAAQGPPDGVAIKIINPLPVPVRNVRDAIEPFQASASCQGSSGENGCGAFIFNVPVGKRAVIQYFSGFASVDVGQMLDPQVSTIQGASAQDHFVPVTAPAFVNGPTGITSWGQQVRLYADSETTIQAGASRSAMTGSFLIKFTISGYLVDVSSTR